jgi:hypothetical protein
MNHTLRIAFLVLACTQQPLLHAATTSELFIIAPEQDEYARGTQALDQQRWQDAVTSFDRVVEAKNKKADAALYWKAYALNKLGRTALVSSTCTQLHSTYAASTWNKDCSALTLTDPTAARVPVSQVEGSHRTEIGSDADLKALALNSLLNRDAAQALPLIRNMLTSNNSPELKHRTLAMLAQNRSPEAQAMLRDVAMGKLAPDEQRQAIQMIGVFQGKRGNDTLAEIYRTSSDAAIKRAVISAFFISGDAQRMVDLARNEKDLSLKHDIVAQLALMNDKAATDYMTELLK